MKGNPQNNKKIREGKRKSGIRRTLQKNGENETSREPYGFARNNKAEKKKTNSFPRGKKEKGKRDSDWDHKGELKHTMPRKR